MDQQSRTEVDKANFLVEQLGKFINVLLADVCWVFEHPDSSWLWRMQPFDSLRASHHYATYDLCCFGGPTQR
eukprot:890141-Amphidinium_carterae.1